MRMIAILLLIPLLAGCTVLYKGSVLPNSMATSPNEYLEYQPIDPLPADKVKAYDPLTNQMKETVWASIIHKNREVRDLLPIQSAHIFARKIDMGGKVSCLGSSVTGETGTYEIDMDFMKYRVEDVMDPNGRFLGSGWVGVGVRIKAIVQTNKADLNLAGPLAIGVEARTGAIKGEVSVSVIGIDSQDVTNLIPLTSEIDQTSIQSALQACASIKTKLCDPNTALTPHLVAIKQAQPRSLARIKEKLTAEMQAGIEQGKTNRAQMNDILAVVAPNNVLNKAKWDGLVNRTHLSDAEKTRLKDWDDYATVKGQLTSDAGGEGAVIRALHAELKTGN